MQENYSSTQLPTVASTGGGGKFGGDPWTNPNNILTDDSSSASWGAYMGGQTSWISGSSFAFPALPDDAVIDGILVYIEGSQLGAYGDVSLNIAGTTYKSIGALNGNFGGSTDLWGAAIIDPADIAGLSVLVSVGDVSGGDAITSIEHLKATVYWHIESTTAPADVPTRVVYKVYSRDGNYLGELPDVSSKLSLAQDINSAGTVIDISCAKDLRNVTEVEPLLTEAGDPILTEDDHIIYAELTEMLIAAGSAEDEALFKNSNRIAAWLYNYWYPNGKLIFSGQVNRVSFGYGANTGYVNLRVFSDGHDLANYIARGYPFTYTTDVSQTSSGSSKTLTFYSMGGWQTYGQTWRTGGSVSNLGAITLRVQGTARLKINVQDAPGGNLIGSITLDVNSPGVWQDLRFELSQLLDVLPNTTYFFSLWLDKGQSLLIATSASDVYANGTLYQSDYSGGSGGGSFVPITGDMYFITASGLPTTTTTYSTQDPITGMMDKILLDYNNRGGYIKKRDFTAAGYNLTYTFNMATILDVMKKVIDMSPRGYYAYIDLGTAEMDIAAVSTTPDFTVVNGNDIDAAEIALTTEQVKNYLLFTGGEVSGSNLYRDYSDPDSAAYYGIRTATQSDNRVTLAATADAIGNSFIQENASEQHETQITVLNKHIDITQLVPGKTIGFKNFDNFIDQLVLQIVRREYTPETVTLTLGRLPVTLTAEVQRLMRDLLNEQTAKNPATPS